MFKAVWVIAVAVSILILFGGALRAQECPGPSVALYQARAAADPAISTYATLSGAKAARFVASYNADPPVSDIQADTVIIFAHKETPVMFVVMARGGCVVAAGPTDEATVIRLMNGGRPA